MKFTKMQGIGNDYVYVDGFSQAVVDPPGLARAVSDRHFGVGSDGLILIVPSTRADVRMRMFNADGSESEMCGNGIRCVAKFAFDHGLSRANPMRVETGRGVLSIELSLDHRGKVALATVDMGEPILAAADIPTTLAGERVVDVPLPAALIDTTRSHAASADVEETMTCVSMGNPHVVVYCRDVSKIPLYKLGPLYENHATFPRRINVHFVQVVSAGEAIMRTWERGSGITMACGTGACAVCVAGVLTGKTGRKLLAHLPGGDLALEWKQSDNHVLMTGPATEVFTGDWPE